MKMIRSAIYRAAMRIAHRYNWHYAPPIYPDGDTQLWCKWCGFRQTIKLREKPADVAAQARQSQPVSVCSDPECGCKEPLFTEPMEALEFLSNRFKCAGVGEGVALAYARDIDKILARQSQPVVVSEAVKTLIDFTKTAPGRLPSRVQDAIDAAQEANREGS